VMLSPPPSTRCLLHLFFDHWIY